LEKNSLLTTKTAPANIIELQFGRVEYESAGYKKMLKHYALNLFLQLGKFFVNPSHYLYPKSLILYSDAERRIVDEFVAAIPNAKNSALLLDAGAGSFRYRDTLMNKGYTYESQDFVNVFDLSKRGQHTYTCDINAIPVEAERFEVIICTQVLEHLENPLTAFLELERILKKGGSLYLTTNFLFPIHGEPFDYFRFTKFGLQSLSSASGFVINEIQPRGGFFSLVAKIIFDGPAVLKCWLLYGGVSPHGHYEIKPKNSFFVLILLPIVFLLDLACTLTAFFISKFDFLDRKKRFTLGYQLHVLKKLHP